MTRKADHFRLRAITQSGTPMWAKAGYLGSAPQMTVASELAALWPTRDAVIKEIPVFLGTFEGLGNWQIEPLEPEYTRVVEMIAADVSSDPQHCPACNRAVAILISDRETVLCEPPKRNSDNAWVISPHRCPRGWKLQPVEGEPQ